MILKKAEWTFKKILMRFLGKVIFIKKVSNIPLKEAKSILIVRQHNQLGDMLCATPLFKAIKENIPESTLHLVSGPVNTQIVLNNPYLDKIIEYNNVKILKSFSAFFGFFKELRKERYDLVIVPATVSRSVTSDLIAFLSRSKYRIGPGSLSEQENLTGFLYNYPVDLSWRNEPLKHQTQRNIDILRDFKLSVSDYSLMVGLTPEEKEYGNLYFQKKHTKGKIAVGIHPGAGKLNNQWPAEKFCQLIGLLMEKNNCEIFITEGPMDKIPVQQIRNKFGDRINYILEGNVRNVASIIRNMTIFISNDTGIMHVASAVNNPVLALFGETDPLQWAPKGEKDKYLLGKEGKINSISVEKVYDSAVKMIDTIIPGLSK